MTPYPSQEELSLFLQHHHLGTMQSIKFLAQGIESTTFSLTTKTDSFILTLFIDQETPLAWMQKTTRFFTTQGFPFIKIVATGEIDEHPAMLSYPLIGKGKNQLLASDYTALGFLLGNLHKYAETLSITPITPPFLWQLSQRFFDIQHRVPSEFHRLEQEIFYLEDNWPHSLPKGLIHGDLWYSNLFFLHDSISGVLNFCPTYDPFLLDLANLLKGTTDDTHTAALLSAYEIVRPLSTEESTALPLCIYAKLVSTILFLLKKAIHYPQRKDEFQTHAFLNLLKLDSFAHLQTLRK